MKSKKVLKIIGMAFIGITILVSVLVAYLYYQGYGKYPTNEEKYSHHVGYIDPTSSHQVVADFSLCGEKQVVGSYQSAAPRIYRGSKHVFRKFILANYKNEGFSDSGLLNLRFHINCHGQVGNVEINELDTDFNKASFSKALVDQVMALAFRPENWEMFRGEHYNYYMYLNFNIKDGNIIEITP